MERVLIVRHVLSMLALVGCVGAAPTTMPFSTIARGDRSQIEEPRQVVVRGAAQWSALWKEHGGAGSPPAVDFSGSMVVAVFLGTRPTAGYSVEIARIDRQGDGLVVTYREHRPPPDAMVAQVLTAPFDIVRTVRSDDPVTFEPAR